MPENNPNVLIDSEDDNIIDPTDADSFRDLWQRGIDIIFKRAADYVDNINPDSTDNSELYFVPDYHFDCDAVAVIAIQDCPLSYYYNNRGDKACFSYHFEISNGDAFLTNMQWLGTLEGFPSIQGEGPDMLQNFQNFYKSLAPWDGHYPMLRWAGCKDVLDNGQLFPYKQYTTDRFYSILCKSNDINYSNWLDCTYNRYSWSGWQSGSYYFNPLDKAFLNIAFNNTVTYNENTGNYSITGSNDGWLPVNAEGSTFTVLPMTSAPVITNSTDDVVNNTIINYHTTNNVNNNTYNYTTNNGDTITINYGDNYLIYEDDGIEINYKELKDALTDAIDDININLNFDNPLVIPEYEDISINYIDRGSFYITPIKQIPKLPLAPDLADTVIDISEPVGVLTDGFNGVLGAYDALGITLMVSFTFIARLLIRKIRGE